MKKILAFSILSLVLSFNLLAQPGKSWIGKKQIYFGASYYPEVWPATEIDGDIKRMKELNMNVMRLAEFSWSTLEPSEGQYNFKWLHNVIDKLGAAGIDVIIGTPSATPPVWMLEKYPDMLRTDADGKKATIGMRRDCSYTSATYRQKSVEIAEKMAKEFGNKPNLIGWQIDNEFSVSPDYSLETGKLWHSWLQKRYGTIETLNKTWSTMLWSQTFSNFEQVFMPDLKEWYNPSLKFNYVRFTNDQISAFNDLQANAIRKYSKAPITHDGMPGQNVDYEKLFKNMDFMAVNNYHSFEAYDLILSNYDRMRGFGKGKHWLTETAPNYSGGGNNGSAWFLHQPEGSMRAALWMNYALGGQAALYWLWRQHPAGQEVTHGSVMMAWNKPAANYNDIKVLGEELKRTSDFQMSTEVPKAKIAVLYNHENRVGLEYEQYANDLKYYNDWTYRFFLPIANQYLHRDVILPTSDIAGYKIIFAPLAPFLADAFKEKLKKFVSDGGTLVLGPMTGYRTEEWTCFTNGMMGEWEKFAGIEGESIIPIGTKSRPAEISLPLDFTGVPGLEQAQIAGLWAVSLNSEKGTVLAKYGNGMQKGKAAIIENKVGKGKIVMLGTDPGKKGIAKLFAKLAAEQNISPLATGDEGVVIAPREGKNTQGTIIVNIANARKNIILPKPGIDLISGQKFTANLDLAPYQVLIIQ